MLSDGAVGRTFVRVRRDLEVCESRLALLLEAPDSVLSKEGSLPDAMRHARNSVRAIQDFLDGANALVPFSRAASNDTLLSHFLGQIDEAAVDIKASLGNRKHDELSLKIGEQIDGATGKLNRGTVELAKVLRKSISELDDATAEDQLDELTGETIEQLTASDVGRRNYDPDRAARAVDPDKMRRLTGAIQQLQNTYELSRGVVAGIRDRFDPEDLKAINDEFGPLEDLVELVGRVSSFFRAAVADRVVSQLLAGDISTVVEAEGLGRQMFDLSLGFENVWDRELTKLRTEVVQQIEESRGRALLSIETILKSVRSLANRIEDRASHDRLSTQVEDLVREVSSARLLVSTRKAARDAERAADSSRRAAGEAGTNEQFRHYGEFADAEQRSANVLRYCTAGILLAISAIAAFVIFSTSVESPALTLELARLAIVLPLAALAAYLGREAARHRQRAIWARQLAMQLSTFDAFIQPLDGSKRLELRASFGSSLYRAGESIAEVSEKGPSVIADVTSLVDATARLTQK